MIELLSTTTDKLAIDLVDGDAVDVRRCHLEFQRSQEIIDFESGTYANKTLVSVQGRSFFGELAILELARDQGWDGVWLDTFHGSKIWRDMPHVSEPCLLSEERQALLDRVRDRHGKAGGAWDVFAWKEGEVAFLESKSPGDQIRDSQIGWLSAALAEGVPLSAFTVVEWIALGSSPEGSPRARPARLQSGRLPVESDFNRVLPAVYREKLRKMGFSPAMDNTLRRVRAGAATYPSRLKPAQKRGLVSADGQQVTETAEDLLAFLDRWLEGDDYPAGLLA